MKSQGEIEAAVCEGMSRLEQEIGMATVLSAN